ncbi:MAG TPA: hypothetical protein VGR97_02000 [Candidatus Acidoferrales bacterium]|nr:hypothetical protein [Candidatus Acidoferrales bacterium]
MLRPRGWRRNRESWSGYFTTAFFHRPEELDAEIREAGFEDVRVLAVEGPIWSAAQFSQTWGDPVQRKELMEFLSLVEREPSVLGASAHLLAAGRA